MAFYCAGEAIGTGHNPYRVEPLRSCEHRVAPETNPPSIAEPAPLPGYALAPFALLARLDYPIAAAIFVALSLAGFVVSAYTLAPLARVPLATAFSSLIVIDGYIDVSYGENATLALAAVCVAGYFTAIGRDRAAGLAAAVAMFEPHVGLAACASLFLWRARSRVPLLLTGAAFLLLSLVVVSPHTFAEYFARELPLQARSETVSSDQYSLTWLAFLLGASDDVAARIGSYCYVAFFISGVALARRVARAFGAPALLVFFPCAATAFLGVFIHDIELPAAIPAALVIAARTSSRVAWLALAMLTIAWMPWWFGVREVVVLTALSLATLVWTVTPSQVARGRRIVLTVGSAMLYYGALKAYTAIPFIRIGTPHSLWPAAVEVGSSASSALSWGLLMRAEANAVPTNLQLLAGKCIVWTALAAIITIGVTRRRNHSTTFRSRSISSWLSQ